MALEEIGEQWNLLIIREVFWGYHRFSDFHQHLGLAKNLLSERLKKLCQYDILKQAPMKPGSKRMEYHLTSKGYELYPVLLAIMQWGNHWLYEDNDVPYVVNDAQGNLVSSQIPCRSDGNPVAYSQLHLTPGPAADDLVLSRLNHLKANQE